MVKKVFWLAGWKTQQMPIKYIQTTNVTSNDWLHCSEWADTRKKCSSEYM